MIEHSLWPAPNCCVIVAAKCHKQKSHIGLSWVYMSSKFYLTFPVLLAISNQILLGEWVLICAKIWLSYFRFALLLNPLFRFGHYIEINSVAVNKSRRSRTYVHGRWDCILKQKNKLEQGIIRLYETQFNCTPNNENAQ